MNAKLVAMLKWLSSLATTDMTKAAFIIAAAWMASVWWWIEFQEDLAYINAPRVQAEANYWEATTLIQEKTADSLGIELPAKVVWDTCTANADSLGVTLEFPRYGEVLSIVGTGAAFRVSIPGGDPAILTIPASSFSEWEAGTKITMRLHQVTQDKRFIRCEHLVRFTVPLESEPPPSTDG